MLLKRGRQAPWRHEATTLAALPGRVPATRLQDQTGADGATIDKVNSMNDMYRQRCASRAPGGDGQAVDEAEFCMKEA